MNYVFNFMLSIWIFLLSLSSYADVDITGDWKIIDDKSSMTLVKVRIKQTKDQIYEGRVLEVYPAPGQHLQDTTQYKNFLLLSDLKADPKQERRFYGGTAIDPIKKEVHKNVTAKLNTRGTVLIFRGKSDEAVASRGLAWVRVE